MNRIAGLGRISEGAVRTCRHLPGRPPRYASESIRHGFGATQSRRQTTVFCAISNDRNRLWHPGYKNLVVPKKLQLINKIKAERNPTSRPPAPALRPARFANLKIIYLAAGFYGRNQPARLLPAARPCFGRRLRIAIFRKNPRVSTSGLTISVVGLRSIPALDDAPATIENRQTLFKLSLFRRDPSGKNPANLFMERPEIIDRHRFQIDLLHRHIAALLFVL